MPAKPITPSRMRYGFTLIELLIVVAIIALLISILLPSLNQARKQARQLLCATNLRSIGSAATFYAEDNRGILVTGNLSNKQPQAGPLPRPYIEWSTPAIELLKYLDYTPDPTVKHGLSEIKNLWGRDGRSTAAYNRWTNAFSRMPVYNCPDHPDPDSKYDYVSNTMPIPFSQVQADKSGNLDAADADSAEGQDVTEVDYYAFRDGKWRNGIAPADVVYFTESQANLREDILIRDQRPNPYIYYTFFIGAHLPLAGLPRIANDQRHPGGTNGLFYDGHVETKQVIGWDPGWPNALSLRLRWFAPFDRGVTDP